MTGPNSNPLFHVVLHEPEIPNNTGNIGRTCVATACALHLIHPLGFDTSEKECRRAGLDYWPRLGVSEHESWGQYLQDVHHRATPGPAAPGEVSLGPSLWLLSTKATRTVFDVPLRRGDHLVFGKESAGLPGSLLNERPDRCVSLPMLPTERSLNLATAVCAVIYEGLRQLIARGDLALDAAGRIAMEKSR